MKIWLNKAENFEAAERFDRDYYLKMSREQRLETVQMLREIGFKNNKDNENTKRLRRVVRIIKQT